MLALGLFIAVVLLVIFIALFIIERQKNKNIAENARKNEQKIANIEGNLQEKIVAAVKYKTLFVEQQKATAEKIKLLKHNEAHLKSQFQNLATQILESNSAKFSQQNQINLDNIIKPMQERLNDFKELVEKNYLDETKERSALKQELQTLRGLNQKISIEAQNLTTALKSNNATTGSWGEMVLENVLENSGLRKGAEYSRQVVLKNSDGKIYKPDVVVNLPNDRQVIIDAKTSLINYEKYTSSSDDAIREKNLNLHIKSIVNHVKELADKEYENLQNINTLDFIFMFIPIESALMLAFEYDKSLFDMAFAKKIVLVSPTTLLIALKAVESSWRYERQAKNTEEVVRLATSLYDKVRGFTDDFEKIGKSLESANKTYDEALNKLSKGRGNVIKQIEAFKEKSNIKPKKQISNNLLES